MLQSLNSDFFGIYDLQQADLAGITNLTQVEQGFATQLGHRPPRWRVHCLLQQHLQQGLDQTGMITETQALINEFNKTLAYNPYNNVRSLCYFLDTYTFMVCVLCSVCNACAPLLTRRL